MRKRQAGHIRAITSFYEEKLVSVKDPQYLTRQRFYSQQSHCQQIKKDNSQDSLFGTNIRPLKLRNSQHVERFRSKTQAFLGPFKQNTLKFNLLKQQALSGFRRPGTNETTVPRQHPIHNRYIRHRSIQQARKSSKRCYTQQPKDESFIYNNLNVRQQQSDKPLIDLLKLSTDNVKTLKKFKDYLQEKHWRVPKVVLRVVEEDQQF